MSNSPANRAPAYRAFISYSHADKVWGDWLHKALETYRVPSRLVGAKTSAGVIPRRLDPIFRDREELASAHDLGNKVNEALGQSDTLIVICSPHSAQSRWVNEEVSAFKRLDRPERIFCLIVDGEPDATDKPGHEAEECFCPALRFRLDEHGQPTRERTEPIAADARSGKDGKSNAKLKLIAGMLDVGFDALKRREQHRQMQRMMTITALALVVMAITSVLAVYALISRHEAVVAQQAAQRRQTQAEGLINFMLGDLTTRLRRFDKLDILRAVDDKAMAYFNSLSPTDVNPIELAQRARALQRIGEVRMDQSRLPDAMDAFQQALRLNRQIIQQAPHDPLRQNAYAENLLWVGYNDWNQGKLDLAETAFRQSAAALELAVMLAPSNNDIASNLGNVYTNLGHVAQARGELDFAGREFTKEQALSRRMAIAHPDSVDWQEARAHAVDDLATIALIRGDLGGAIAGYLQEQRVLQHAVVKHPQDRQLSDDLLISDAILGRTLAFAGKTPAGIGYVESALAIGKAQLQFDPGHTEWQDNYAFYSALLGQLRLEQGEIEAAREPTKTSIAMLGTLVAKDPSNSQWLGNLAEAELQGAQLALARKQPAEAQRLATVAMKNIGKPLADSPSSSHLIGVAAKIELTLGLIADDAGKVDAAEKYREQALTRIHRITVRSSDPRSLAMLVDVLSASGKGGEAQPYIGILQKMGYRPIGFVARLQARGIDYPEDPAFDARITRWLTSDALDHSPTAAHQ